MQGTAWAGRRGGRLSQWPGERLKVCNEGMKRRVVFIQRMVEDKGRAPSASHMGSERTLQGVGWTWDGEQKGTRQETFRVFYSWGLWLQNLSTGKAETLDLICVEGSLELV